MSDTPRTDAHKAKMPSGINGLQEAVWIANQHLEFARTLERQNAELLAALKQADAQMGMAAECIEAGRYDEALLHARSLRRPRIEAIRRAEA